MAAEDPYVRRSLTFKAYSRKCDLEATVVAVLRGTLHDRNLELIPQPSRAVRQGDVHEVILTDEAADPGSKVGRVAYVAFLEFLNGGVLLAGDLLSIQGIEVGRLSGFDLSHFPNHMNIVVQGRLESGEELGIALGGEARFRMAQTIGPAPASPV